MGFELLYRLYERRLAAGLRGGALPRHVGVVLDGNRRFAREKGLGTVADGHRIGAGKIHELVDWCHELGVPYVTLWLLSTDNLQRDAAEVSDLVGIIAETVTRMATDPRNQSRGLRVTAVGALDVIPDELRGVLKEAEEVTAAGEGLHVQVAVGYGGRQEITDALRSLLEERQAEGASLEEVITGLTPRPSRPTSTPTAHPTRTSSSARRGRFACRGSCCGSRPTASSTSVTASGRRSARPISCVPSATSHPANAATASRERDERRTHGHRRPRRCTVAHAR